MNATIANFRMAKHHKSNNQMVIEVEGIEDKVKAKGLVGKQVIFTTQTGKEIKGKITNPHGNGGAVRAIFETGMPGQSVGQKVKIQ